MKLNNEQIEKIKYGMPDGWFNRFGKEFIKDLEDVLTANDITDFQIYDVKEKFGSLRMYSNAPEEWDDHMEAWEDISERTCIVCGKFPVFTKTTGWICPVCEECASKEDLGKLRKSDDQKLSSKLVIYTYSINGDSQREIDLRPYYKKMGYEYYER